MRQTEMMRLSFEDELNKIAGELRTGRRPIGVERLLERDREDSDEFSIGDGVKLSAVPWKALGAAAAGAGTYHVVNKVNNDRKMGRAMRLQQGGQGF